jgi:hypothetical protein
MRTEHAPAREERGGASSHAVIVQGLAEATNLAAHDIAALVRADKVWALFGPDGKIKPEFRRALSGSEARARLEQRHPDGSPRKRCPTCGDPYDDAWSCYCIRPRTREDVMPPGRGGYYPEDRAARRPCTCGHGHSLATACPYATSAPPRLSVVGATYQTIRIRLEDDGVQVGTFPGDN